MRAALTARSMSAASPSATWAITSSVAGLIVANVLPLTLSRHLPSISILVWMLPVAALALDFVGFVMVAMRRTPFGVEETCPPVPNRKAQHPFIC